MSIEEITSDESNGGLKRVISNLNSSFLDAVNGVPKLEIIKAYKISNRALEDSFKNKVNEFVANGCKESELETKIGFLVENDCKEISELMQSGVAVRKSDNNTIGYNCMGVYLSRHLDVCLKHCLAKMSSVDHYKIIVCQYITGKTTTAIPRAAVMGEFIEPTPNFTSHVSIIPPSPRDSIQTQFDRSQVYIYELDDNDCPVLTPRQVLPLWVVVYAGAGAGAAVASKVEAEMAQIVSPSNDIAHNLRLQRAIELINSRGQPAEPSKLQRVIDNINYKMQAPNLMDSIYEDMFDEMGNNYGAKLNPHQLHLPNLLTSTHLTNQHLTNQHLTNQHLTNQHLTNQHLTNQHLTNQHLTNQHLTNQHLTNQHLTNQHLTNQHLTSDDFSSLNLLSGLNEPLYYCSDTNNILDVNGLLALAEAHQNITTLLPCNATPSPDLSSQTPHDYYPLNYLNQHNKALQQQQELMYASSSSSSSSSSIPLQNMNKRHHKDPNQSYHQVYDKKVRIM